MKRFLLARVVPFGFFLVFFGTAVALQNRNMEKVRLNPPFVETWQLSGRSSELLSWMSLRYRQVTADFLWLRAIQSFGGRGMTNRDWVPLFNLFDAISDLDPYFENAYTFGNLVIGDEGGFQREALRLLDKGTYKLIHHHRIPFEALYVAHWQLNDNKLAKYYGRVTLKRPDCPDWVPRIVGYIEVASGEFYVGLDRFLSNLTIALDAEDHLLQDIAINKLRETIEKWSQSILSGAVDEYTSRTGTLPAALSDLTDTAALTNYEMAPLSRVLGLVSVYAARKGRPGIFPNLLENYVKPSPQLLAALDRETTRSIEGRSWADLHAEIFDRSLTTMSGVPEEPSGREFFLNRTALGNPFMKKTEVIMTGDVMEHFVRGLLAEVRSVIATRKEELGRNPEVLREVFYTDFLTTEPLGGEWIYDPETGDFKTTSRPDW